jgi:hypothetical protein
MVICPLQLNECTTFISPKPKTVFIMAPSDSSKTTKCRQVLKEVNISLSKNGFVPLEGAKIVEYGDYFCSICRNLQSCAFGIALVNEDIPIRTVANIFVEAGLMQGFGKPVILLIDRKTNLPSDYIRTFVVYSNKKNYMSKFMELMKRIMDLEHYYSDQLGHFALRAGDYEKACKYYQEAFLIGANRSTLDKIREIISELKSQKDIPDSYKKRLVESAEHFCKAVS